MQRKALIILGLLFSFSCVANDVDLYTKRAEQGDAKAQYNLGVLYTFGEGVLQNDKEAVRWYQKGAEQGDGYAQFNLAAMYGNGRGVPRNVNIGYAWTILAVYHGYDYDLNQYPYSVDKAKAALRSCEQSPNAKAFAALTKTLIPSQIADKLRGKEFSNFDDFRRAFWKEVSKDPTLAGQFNLSNIKRMKDGKAPRARFKDTVGGRRSFELHHVKEIQHGGDVYNVDNIRVNTPRNHINIHKGKR